MDHGVATTHLSTLRSDGLPVDQPKRPPLAARTWTTNPAARLSGFVLVAGATAAVLYVLASLIPAAARTTWWAPVQATFLVVPTVVAYWVVGRFLERRPLTELASARAGGLVVGLLLGVVLVSVCVAGIWVLGGIRFHGVQTPSDWVRMLSVAGLQAAVVEEILFRGMLYRYAEEGFGTWAAVALSSAVFGLMHLGNPGATWLSTVAIAVEAGLPFAALYALTRNLWLVIGLHFAWNISQWLLFSIPISGGTSVGAVATSPAGPDLVSGGAFGIEASLVTTVFLGGLAVLALLQLHGRGLVVQPFWTRRRLHRDG